MIFYKSKSKKYRLFLLLYLILWVLLFEFIIPVNKFIPKPSSVVSAFPALWNEYSLAFNLFSTLFAVYIPLIVAYLMIKYLAAILLRDNHIITQFIVSLEWFSEYIPGVIFGFFLIFWFPLSEYTEFLFAFGTAFMGLLIKVKREAEILNPAYIDAARSLGADMNVIRKRILWSNMQPNLINYLSELHFYLWLLLIVFEFIKGGFGIGSVFSDVLRYSDLSGLFILSAITGLLIFTGDLIIKFLGKRYLRW
jgi:ABC-type nitrate/sulfonate/bicarbonate transport system permease component